MDVEEYISSGILELYVAGALTEEQNMEVYRYAEEFPEIRQEILAIENSIRELSKKAAHRPTGTRTFRDLLPRIGEDSSPGVVTMPRRRSPWATYTGWAAAIIFAAGLYWFYLQNGQLRSEMQLRSNEIQVLEEQIFQARSSRDNMELLLNTIRDKDITFVALDGQTVAPDSYARAYWNTAESKVYIDAQGLPEPPPGMVYQVWSLKLSPLTPTSIGLLEDFATDENKIFALANPNESEAFGITLEPEGGSETPTMEQLYTLGNVAS